METFSMLLALCAGNSPVPVNFPHKGQWRGALMFSLICVRINDWVNSREGGDLRRHRGHYDVNVMHGFGLAGECANTGLTLKSYIIQAPGPQQLIVQIRPIYISRNIIIAVANRIWQWLSLLSCAGFANVSKRDLEPLLLTWFNFNSSRDK